MKLTYWRLAPLLIFALLVLFFWRGLSLDPQRLPSMKLGMPVPFFQLPTLEAPLTQFTPLVMRGQVSLLNVWGSWCAACADEQVFLLQLAREGLAIYGLNYKDTHENASNWLTTWGNPYRMIGADMNGRVAIDLGVYGAPETFLIDKAGIIRYRYAGALNTHVWQQEFLPRIQQLEGAS